VAASLAEAKDMPVLVRIAPALLLAAALPTERPHAPPPYHIATESEAVAHDRPAAAPAPADACAPGCDAPIWVRKADVLNDTSDPGRGVEGAAAGIIGGKIYVAHGLSDGDGSTLRIYDIAADTWSFGPNARFPRSEGGGAAIGTRLYSVGGRSGGPSAVLEIFDTVTATWSIGRSMSIARAGAAVVAIGGKLHVAGGRASSSPETGPVLAAHEVYDPATATWSARAPLPTAVGDCYAAVGIGDRLYVFGGFDGTTSVAHTQIYDDTTGAWSIGTPMPTPRANGVAGVLGTRIAVIAGRNGSNLTTVELYDPATDTWCTGPPKPRAASELATGAVSTGTAIYTIGSGAFGVARNYHEALVLSGGSGNDTEPPDLRCPADLDLECPADAAAIEAWLASGSATDNCSTNLTVTTTLLDHAPGCGSTYTDTYEFRVSDGAGNTATCQRHLRVLDSIPPDLLGVPADEVAECDAVPAPANPSASDGCDPNPTVSFGQTRTQVLCEDSYTLTRTWTATDACDNESNRAQVITVRDTQAPLLPGAPEDATVACDAIPPRPDLEPADNCDPDPTLAFRESRNDGSCPDSYTLVRQWTTADRCGNTRIHIQRLSVVDLTPPRIAVPPPLALECNAAGGVDASDPRIQSWLAAATASDDCGDATVSHDAPRLLPSGCAPGAATDVHFVARDDCGNSTPGSSAITVADTTPPVLSACGLVTELLTPELAARGARAPRPPSSAPCVSSRALRIDCGVAADLCGSEPISRTAEVVVDRHEVVDGACTLISERVPVDCDELVVLELLAPPCPAVRQPRDPAPPVSAISGRRWIRGERIELRVTAADGCGNRSAPCADTPVLCPPRPPGCPLPVCSF
jgi:hypothetical protein